MHKNLYINSTFATSKSLFCNFEHSQVLNTLYCQKRGNNNQNLKKIRFFNIKIVYRNHFKLRAFKIKLKFRKCLFQGIPKEA